MEEEQITELKEKGDVIKKKLDKEEEKKKYSFSYTLLFTFFALSLTLFYSNYMIKKSFSQIGAGVQGLQSLNIPLLGDMQYFFSIGAWASLGISLIVLIIILIKKHSFQKLSQYMKNKSNKNNQEIIK